MGPARIYPWRKMHRSRAPSIAPGTFFVAQPWADCITNMPGFNLRQAQVGRYEKGSVLCVLPFDRAANGCLLISRRHTGGRNRTHGLDKLSERPRARRSCTAFVEPAAVLELAVGVVTEEVRRTDRPYA